MVQEDNKSFKQNNEIMENHFNKRVGVTPSEADAVSGRLLFISAGSTSEEGSSWWMRLIIVCLCRNKNTINPIQTVSETPDMKRI